MTIFIIGLIAGIFVGYVYKEQINIAIESIRSLLKK